MKLRENIPSFFGRDSLNIINKVVANSRDKTRRENIDLFIMAISLKFHKYIEMVNTDLEDPEDGFIDYRHWKELKKDRIISILEMIDHLKDALEEEIGINA